MLHYTFSFIFYFACPSLRIPIQGLPNSPSDEGAATREQMVWRKVDRIEARWISLCARQDLHPNIATVTPLWCPTGRMEICWSGDNPKTHGTEISVRIFIGSWGSRWRKGWIRLRVIWRIFGIAGSIQKGLWLIIRRISFFLTLRFKVFILSSFFFFFFFFGVS